MLVDQIESNKETRKRKENEFSLLDFLIIPLRKLSKEEREERGNHAEIIRLYDGEEIVTKKFPEVMIKPEHLPRPTWGFRFLKQYRTIVAVWTMTQSRGTTPPGQQWSRREKTEEGYV